MTSFLPFLLPFNQHLLQCTTFSLLLCRHFNLVDFGLLKLLKFFDLWDKLSDLGLKGLIFRIIRIDVTVGIILEYCTHFRRRRYLTIIFSCWFWNRCLLSGVNGTWLHCLLLWKRHLGSNRLVLWEQCWFWSFMKLFLLQELLRNLIIDYWRLRFLEWSHSLRLPQWLSRIHNLGRIIHVHYNILLICSRKLFDWWLILDSNLNVPFDKSMYLGWAIIVAILDTDNILFDSYLTSNF